MTVNHATRAAIAGLTVVILTLVMWYVAALPHPRAAVAGPSQEQIASLLAEGDREALSRALLALESTDRDLFRNNNYDYLLGRLLEARGDLAAAIIRYTDVSDRGSVLAEYALWHLAGLTRQQGNLTLERRYLERLTGRFPSSLLLSRAVLRIGVSAFESGDYMTAVARLAPFAGPNGHLARDALARVGAAKLRLGDRQGAIAAFEKLLAGGSKDDAALAAVRSLDTLADPYLPPAERARRARIYLANRDWASARNHYAQLIGDTSLRAEALYNTGLTYYRTDDYDAAVEWWERTAREVPNTVEGVRAAYWVGHAHQRAGRWQEAIARYDAFIAAHPNDEQVEGAFRNAIDTARLAHDTDSALEWCNRAENHTPRTALATFAAFNRAKTLLAAGRLAGGLAELGRLHAYNLRHSGPGQPTAAEVQLLQAVVLEHLGRLTEAAQRYLAIPGGRSSYYGNRATARLQRLSVDPRCRDYLAAELALARRRASAAIVAGDWRAAKDAAHRGLRLATDENSRKELIGVLQLAYARLPGYASVRDLPVLGAARAPLTPGTAPSQDRSHGALGAELAFLGLHDEAAAELRAAGVAVKAPAAFAVTASYGAGAEVSLDLGDELARTVPDDYVTELLPRNLARVMYPAPYAETLVHVASRWGVDPRFQLAVVRQESRFDARAKSPAAARGFMQFIPETASRMAQVVGLVSFEDDDVYEPEVAYRLGAAYLGELFTEFTGDPTAVAAAYNGGADAVRRWRHRTAIPDDTDLFVAEIGYRETKDYVAKVLNNYTAYCAIYRPDLQFAGAR
jgi:soluble lytic murein transglycosylase